MVCEFPTDRKPVYYLSGGMRGYPDYNYAAFKKASEWLRRVKGVEVLDPSDHDPTLPLEVLLTLDFEWVLRSDAIVLLPGWWASTGACHELAIARILNKPILNVDLTPCTDKELDLAGHVTVLKTLVRNEDGNYSPLLPFKMEDLDKYLVEEPLCEPSS